MEDVTKEIQAENKQELEDSSVEKPFLPNESPAQKASVFCFKKRKKSCVTEKSEDHESNSLAQKPTSQNSSTKQSEMEVPDPLWTSGGAWLAFKRLVTLRRRPKSTLKKQTQFGSRVQLETSVEDSGALHFPKEHTSSNLKIPCLRFSRRKKSSQPEITEEVDHGEKAKEMISILNNKRNSEPEVVAVEGPLNTEHSPSRAPGEKESDSRVVNNAEELVLSKREDTFAVEMRPGPNQYTDCTAQSEIIHSETVLETEQEKQFFQLHHGSLYGDPQEARNETFDFEDEMGLLLPQDLPESEPRAIEAEGAEHTLANEDELEQFGKDVDVLENANGTKDSNSVEVMLHCSPSAFESEASSEPQCSSEEVGSEENKPTMLGAGIVIMITEAEECPDEELSHSCEPFSFPQANKQKVKKKPSKGLDSGAGGSGYTREGKTCSKVLPPLGANGQEHRTSEQYEMLLIETAASLVKAAIQSSVEQLVNEMALEQNKQNSFL
ncbi:A-kinase anchor protein 5 [Rhineura floridana]|uniref:A-kinase anchor protein 5 n=1 Tax=Rhineura floridana TaxID=261503 RepID=UPI002AC81B8F|nr:A-kinase anchor protein 5 [Rhineura floridana]